MVTATDLAVRVSNDAPNRLAANTWATLAELDAVIKFRIDAALWAPRSEDERVRLAVTAYTDLEKLTYALTYGRSQSKDYGWGELMGEPAGGLPPLGDATFLVHVKRAQAAQVMFLLAGTQVRDMAREGIRMTRALTGSEVEFSGYRGPVGGEALEILGAYLELQPRVRRF